MRTIRGPDDHELLVVAGCGAVELHVPLTTTQPVAIHDQEKVLSQSVIKVINRKMESETPHASGERKVVVNRVPDFFSYRSTCSRRD